MDTLVNDYTDKENIVSSLARNYGLNRDTTKIILNPNFAIIYDVNGNKVKIGELLYNFSVDNGSQQIDITDDVLMQMRLAFEQIANEKKIDVSLLDREQLEIYNRLENIAEEIDMKKGVSYGK